MVRVTGFEPAASCSQSRRATNCATPGYSVFYPAGRIHPKKPRCKMDAVSRSGAEYALSTPRMRPPSCPYASLCWALKCLCASGCKGLPFLRAPPPGLPAFFAMPTGLCRAKASLHSLCPNRAGTSCKQSFYSFAAKTLYTIL